MTRLPRRLALAATMTLATAGVARAVQVQFWTQTAAEDYADAYRDNTVVTSYGAVQLARKLTPLSEAIDGASLVNDLAEAADGTIYAATGPTGVLLRIRGDKTDRYELADAANLLCVLIDADGSLLVGTGGETGRILRVKFDGDAAEVTPLFEQKGVRYVWKLARHADGTLYAATGGDAATLFSIAKDGAAKSVFTAAGETNIESLALTDGDDLYAGTDANGLVWKVDRKSGKGSVLFDAGEPEITSLVRDGDYLYATGASRGEGGQAGDVGEGRPDVGDASSPIGSAAVTPPQSPALPPDQPDRLPMGELQEAPGDDPGIGDEPAELPKAAAAADRAAAAAPRGPSAGLPAGDFAGDGSAIYRIDLRTNLVSGVLRDPHLFLDLVRQDGKLLVAAGADEGEPARLMSFDPATQETSVVAEPDAAQVTRLLPTKDGRLLLGLSNPAGVSACGKGYAEQGTLESAPMDSRCGQCVRHDAARRPRTAGDEGRRQRARGQHGRPGAEPRRLGRLERAGRGPPLLADEPAAGSLFPIQADFRGQRRIDAGGGGREGRVPAAEPAAAGVGRGGGERAGERDAGGPGRSGACRAARRRVRRGPSRGRPTTRTATR